MNPLEAETVEQCKRYLGTTVNVRAEARRQPAHPASKAAEKRADLMIDRLLDRLLELSRAADA